MLVWVQFPQWERKRYIKRVVCYTERKTIMLIEDIDYSTDPEITLACAKCRAENGFKTETVFTDMEQLSKFVDEDVFSILHLGLPCPHGGDAANDIVTIESTCAPEHIAEYYQYYAEYALWFNEIVEKLKNDYCISWDDDIARFVALAAIDRETFNGLDGISLSNFPNADMPLSGFCGVEESFYEYMARDIWDGLLCGVPDDAREFFDLGRYIDYMEAWYYVVDIPDSSLVAIFSE